MFLVLSPIKGPETETAILNLMKMEVRRTQLHLLRSNSSWSLGAHQTVEGPALTWHSYLKNNSMGRCSRAYFKGQMSRLNVGLVDT